MPAKKKNKPQQRRAARDNALQILKLRLDNLKNYEIIDEDSYLKLVSRKTAFERAIKDFQISEKDLEGEDELPAAEKILLEDSCQDVLDHIVRQVKHSKYAKRKKSHESLNSVPSSPRSERSRGGRSSPSLSSDEDARAREEPAAVNTADQVATIMPSETTNVPDIGERGREASDTVVMMFHELCSQVSSMYIVDKVSHKRLSIQRQLIENQWNCLNSKYHIFENNALSSEQQTNLVMKYSEAIATIDAWIEDSPFATQNKTSELTNNATSHINPVNVENLLRLPPIPTPTFDGKYEDWESFRDLFVNLINNNQQLSEIQKFHFLRQSLHGEARSIIKNLTSTSDSFRISWELLSRRYNNPRRLASSYLSKIEDPPEMNKANPQSIRRFLDHAKVHIEAFKSLQLDVPPIDLVFLHKLLSHCSPEIVREWEKATDQQLNPSLEQFFTFLEKLYFVEESCRSNLIETKGAKPHEKQGNVGNVIKAVQPSSCPICKADHNAFQCQKLKEMGADAKLTYFKERRSCLNCLRPNSRNHVCSKYRCKVCFKPHHTLLHEALSSIPHHSSFVTRARRTFSEEASGHVEANTTNQAATRTSTAQDSRNLPSTSREQQDEAEELEEILEVYSCRATKTLTPALLPTATVIVTDDRGQDKLCTALLDSGSSVCLVTEELAQTLNSKRERTNVSIQSVCLANSRATEMTTIKIQSRLTHWSTTEKCLIVPHITSALPAHQIETGDWDIPPELQLADRNFMRPKQIDLLLGVSVTSIMRTSGIVRLKEGLPTLENTMFGWIISGRIPRSGNPNQNAISESEQVHSNHVQLLERQEDEQLEKFWKLEEVNAKGEINAEEKNCEEHFIQTTTHDEEGRYVVRLPRKQSHQPFGDSKTQALRRFKSLEDQLQGNPNSRKLHREFMEEYQKLGHMKLATPAPPLDEHSFQLHHGVLHQNPTTTRRPAFADASMKTTAGISLKNLGHEEPSHQNSRLQIFGGMVHHNKLQPTKHRMSCSSYQQPPAQVWRPKFLKPCSKPRLRISSC